MKLGEYRDMDHWASENPQEFEDLLVGVLQEHPEGLLEEES